MAGERSSVSNSSVPALSLLAPAHSPGAPV
jgi:hypothetical protein